MTKKVYTLTEFQELDLSMQLELIYEHGVFVGKRHEDDREILLYQLGGYYIELYYLEYRKTIDRVVSTSDPSILDPYLDQIR
jgi:hypothetical protein